MQFHVDGALVPAAEATVSIRDRGFRYGDAAFETLRAYNGVVFDWESHMDRLDRTCDQLGLTHGLERSTLRERVQETLSANDLLEAYVRLAITRGEQPGTLTPQPATDPTVVIEVQPLPRGGLQGDSVWDDPATVQTVRTRAIPDDCLPTDGKTHNYLNGVLARLELRRMATDGPPADEALVRDLDGAIASGAASNLFFVDGEGLHTPATDGSVLPGVTRKHVITLARDEEVPVHEGHYDRDALRAADEAFLTNTSWEVRPAATIDGLQLGEGPVTALVSNAFDAMVEQRHY
ncbi:MAG: aminotransferase class IV [Halobacteriaceae archaeon]